MGKVAKVIGFFLLIVLTVVTWAFIALHTVSGLLLIYDKSPLEIMGIRLSTFVPYLALFFFDVGYVIWLWGAIFASNGIKQRALAFLNAGVGILLSLWMFGNAVTATIETATVFERTVTAVLLGAVGWTIISATVFLVLDRNIWDLVNEEVERDELAERTHKKKLGLIRAESAGAEDVVAERQKEEFLRQHTDSVSKSKSAPKANGKAEGNVFEQLLAQMGYSKIAPAPPTERMLQMDVSVPNAPSRDA